MVEKSIKVKIKCTIVSHPNKYGIITFVALPQWHIPTEGLMVSMIGDRGTPLPPPPYYYHASGTPKDNTSTITSIITTTIFH